MPNESLVELQAQAILTQLQTIIEGADYWYTPSSVVRPADLDLVLDHLQVLLLQGEREEIEDGVLNHEEWHQHWQIWFAILPPEGNETPIDTFINRVGQDIVTCLTGGESTWRTIGIQHTLTGPQPLPSEVEITGGVMDLKVHMRTLYGDPTSNGG